MKTIPETLLALALISLVCWRLSGLVNPSALAIAALVIGFVVGVSAESHARAKGSRP